MKTIFHNGAMRKLSPLLMIPELVAQTLKDIKTETRRLNGLDEINEDPEKWKFFESAFYNMFSFFQIDNEEARYIKSPYGQVGDIIWVKEPHYAFGYWYIKGKTKKTNKEKYLFKDEKLGYFYEKEDEFAEVRVVLPNEILTGRTYATGWYKRSPLFMPFIACRLFLEITSARLERLQDITEEGAIAEGVEKKAEMYKLYGFPNYTAVASAKASYMTLWQTINGRDSWKQNPWVWVIQYKRIPKPESLS
jgi:hypothetical protein